jgi:site-specific DNA-methyltransferase (adenine-specific)
VSRVEHIGEAELWLGDCREMLDQLPRDAAIVSDPPYGIGYCHGARARGRLLGTDGMSIVGDDEPFDPSPWLSHECLLWGAEHFKHRLPDGGRWLVWNKRRPGVVRDQGCVENAWHSTRGVTRIFHHVWDGADQGSERGERVHSNQKPISLMEWCLGFVRAQTICDPYCGSGTTGVACVRLGRRFIGIEIDETHFATACRRIEAAYKQPRLFDEPKPAPVQEVMFVGHGTEPEAGWSTKPLRGHHGHYSRLAVRDDTPAAESSASPLHSA